MIQGTWICTDVRSLVAKSAPRVVLESTHEQVLKYAPLSALKRHAMDLH
jgi:uncharacterized protein (DUF2237 family)